MFPGEDCAHPSASLRAGSCRQDRASRVGHAQVRAIHNPKAKGPATRPYLPQALHSFRSKSVRDLSLLMLVSLNVGLVLRVGYGFMIHSLPIILPNAVTFFLSAPLLMMKLRYQRRQDPPV